MRVLYYLPIVAMVAAACGPDNIVVVPTNVEWMEWPAEISAATPFTVRLMVPWVYCNPDVAAFNLGTSVKESAVTFAPYYLVNRHMEIRRAGVLCQYHPPVDTVGTVVGVAASIPRTVGIRAAAHVIGTRTAAVDLVVQTFGDVTVRPSDPDTSRRNAAGFASKGLDNLGCLRIGPSVASDPRSRYVLDDQTDTRTFWGTFVRGYIYDAAAPVCGETRVFHVVVVVPN
jgi:hypothetical protein